MIWFLLIHFIFLPLLLAGLYVYVMKTTDPRNPKGVAAFIAGLLDVYLNYTTFVVYLLDFPRAGEYTFSKRVKRLRFDFGWRGFIAEHVAAFLLHYDKDHLL